MIPLQSLFYLLTHIITIDIGIIHYDMQFKSSQTLLGYVKYAANEMTYTMFYLIC